MLIVSLLLSAALLIVANLVARKSGRLATPQAGRWRLSDQPPPPASDSQPLVAAIAALPRSAISSGVRSSTCVAIDQRWPNGSETVPKRSPQN